MKVKEAEVAAKLACWEEAKAKREKLESTNKQLSNNLDETDRLKRTVDPIQQKIDHVMRKQTDYINYLSEVKEKNLRKSSIEDRIKELRASIKNLFTEDKGKLESMLRDFDHELG